MRVSELPRQSYELARKAFEALIEAKRGEGKTKVSISYVELAHASNISVTYALMLLKQFCYERGGEYIRGTCIVEE